MDTIHNKKIMQGPTPKVFVRGEALVRQSCTKASPLTKGFSGEAAVYGVLPPRFFTYSSRRCWRADQVTMVRTAADFAALNHSSRYFVHTLHYYIEFHYTERVEVDKGHKHQAVVLGAELAAVPYLEQGQTQKQCGTYRSPLTGYPVRHRMKH